IKKSPYDVTCLCPFLHFTSELPQELIAVRGVKTGSAVKADIYMAGSNPFSIGPAAAGVRYNKSDMVLFQQINAFFFKPAIVPGLQGKVITFVSFQCLIKILCSFFMEGKMGWQLDQNRP